MELTYSLSTVKHSTPGARAITFAVLPSSLQQEKNVMPSQNVLQVCDHRIHIWHMVIQFGMQKPQGYIAEKRDSNSICCHENDVPAVR